MTYYEAIEIKDLKRIDKLNNLTDKKVFWRDVRKLTRAVHSDHALNRWQVLAETRFNELERG